MFKSQKLGKTILACLITIFVSISLAAANGEQPTNADPVRAAKHRIQNEKYIEQLEDRNSKLLVVVQELEEDISDEKIKYEKLKAKKQKNEKTYVLRVPFASWGITTDHVQGALAGGIIVLLL